MKLWDLRKFKKPLGLWDNLPANYTTTSVVFSPDERLLLTGTAAGRPSLHVGLDMASAGVHCGEHVPWGWVFVRDLGEVAVVNPKDLRVGKSKHTPLH